MARKPNQIRQFATEADERACFPALKPSTASISLRLPVGLLDKIKIEANKRDVPYQSLITMWLAEKAG